MEIITRYFIAMAFMLMFLFFWMLVQKLSRKVAKTHPEFGPAREEGDGRGSRNEHQADGQYLFHLETPPRAPSTYQTGLTLRLGSSAVDTTSRPWS